jgi:hypothetical protein
MTANSSSPQNWVCTAASFSPVWSITNNSWFFMFF